MARSYDEAKESDGSGKNPRVGYLEARAPAPRERPQEIGLAAEIIPTVFGLSLWTGAHARDLWGAGSNRSWQP